MPFQKLTPVAYADIATWVNLRKTLGGMKTIAAKHGVSVSTVRRVQRLEARRAEGQPDDKRQKTGRKRIK